MTNWIMFGIGTAFVFALFSASAHKRKIMDEKLDHILYHINQGAVDQRFVDIVQGKDWMIPRDENLDNSETTIERITPMTATEKLDELYRERNIILTRWDNQYYEMHKTPQSSKEDKERLYKLECRYDFLVLEIDALERELGLKIKRKPWWELFGFNK